MDRAKFQTSGLLDNIDNLGVLLGRCPRHLDFDGVLTARTYHRFRHAGAIQAIRHNFNRIFQLLRLLITTQFTLRRFVDFHGHTHAALQVQTQAQLALRAAQQML